MIGTLQHLVGQLIFHVPTIRLTILQAYFALVDLVLALLPTTLLWNLQMSWTRKIGLFILLGLGVL